MELLKEHMAQQEAALQDPQVPVATAATVSMEPIG